MISRFMNLHIKLKKCTGYGDRAKGYALTGDESYLEPYSNGLVEWRINFAKLHGLITDNPEQVGNLNNISENIEKWIDEAGQYVVDLKRNGQNETVSAFFAMTQVK